MNLEHQIERVARRIVLGMLLLFAVAAGRQAWAFNSNNSILDTFTNSGGTQIVPNNNQLGIFARSRSSLFNLAGLLINGNFDLSFGFPQPVPGFSRISVPQDQLVNRNLKDRTILIRNARTGDVEREAVLRDDGIIVSRPTNAFGQALVNFFVPGQLARDALGQASQFFLENNNLGSFNKLADQLIGNIRIGDAIAANNLAARELGSLGRRGIVRIQCPMDYGNQPMDLLAAKVNESQKNATDPNLLRMNWAQRCQALMLYTLNTLVDPFKPPIMPSQVSVDANGVMTIRGLLNNFNQRSLGIVFARSKNTDLCNQGPLPDNVVWSEEDVLRQALNPNVYNKVKGLDPDDVGRNILLTTGAVLGVPRRYQGALGAAIGVGASTLRDLAFTWNKESRVATSGQTREIRVMGGNAPLIVTFDTNSDRSGKTELASQDAAFSGANNQGFQQFEAFMGDPLGYGRDFLNSILAGAPDKDGKMKLATEAPATAAHTGLKAVVANQCYSCHDSGSNLIRGKYTPLDIQNANGIRNLSPTLAIASAKFQNFLAMIGAAVPKTPKSDSPDDKGLIPLPTTALAQANLPRSQAFVSLQMGYPPGAISGLIARDPSMAQKLLLDSKGDIDPLRLSAGAKCSIKAALGDPRLKGPSLAQPGGTFAGVPATGSRRPGHL